MMILLSTGLINTCSSLFNSGILVIRIFGGGVKELVATANVGATKRPRRIRKVLTYQESPPDNFWSTNSFIVNVSLYGVGANFDRPEMVMER